ncbi:hypothetical protein DFJ73DRAFT_795111 [Zopfochytrium polystomum]|nr:hypothetical protein DFJ73DRAFT_795111 [Zopfochytrium polystomum]
MIQFYFNDHSCGDDSKTQNAVALSGAKAFVDEIERDCGSTELAQGTQKACSVRLLIRFVIVNTRWSKLRARLFASSGATTTFLTAVALDPRLLRDSPGSQDTTDDNFRLLWPYAPRVAAPTFSPTLSSPPPPPCGSARWTPLLSRLVLDCTMSASFETRDAAAVLAALSDRASIGFLDASSARSISPER